jgi:hypothetical protein
VNLLEESPAEEQLLALPVMPNLAQSQAGFHHTVDSALEILYSMNVSATRISLSMAGKGMPSRWVVSQSPAPGTPLGPGQTIQIEVAGLGYFHNLPVALWDAGGESEAGTREILSAIDDPYQKAVHWLREGARLFDISRTNLDACARWIALFGLNPEEWPSETWYSLAILLPSLQSLAGKERGMRFALHLLLDLPLEKITRHSQFRHMEKEELSLVAERFGRVGVDLIVGDRVEDLAVLKVWLGPVSLETYYAFQKDDKKALLDAVMYLICPCHQRYRVAWSVQDRAKPPRLGIEVDNGRLGVNTHLGVVTA